MRLKSPKLQRYGNHTWRCYGASDEPDRYRRRFNDHDGVIPLMANIFDTRKSCTPFDQNSTLIAVIELSQVSWLVGGIVPGLERNRNRGRSPGVQAAACLLRSSASLGTAFASSTPRRLPR